MLNLYIMVGSASEIVGCDCTLISNVWRNMMVNIWNVF